MMHSAAVAALGFGLLGQARGDTAPELSLDLDPCVPVPAEPVLRQTALELDVRVVPLSAARPSATRVRVSCVESHLQLRVSDPITGKHLERTLALTTEEVDVAGRLVALAVSELVLTSWMELTLKQERPATTGFVVAPPEARRAAQRRAEESAEPSARVSYVQAFGQVVGPFERLGVGYGGGLRLGWASKQDWLGGDIDVAASRSDASTPLGRVLVSTWSAGVRLALRLPVRPVWFDVGPGARFGLARIEGQANDSLLARSATLAGTWGGPLLYTGVGLRVWHCVLAIGAESGYVLRSISGKVEGGSPVAVDGIWLAGSVGLGWGQ